MQIFNSEDFISQKGFGGVVSKGVDDVFVSNWALTRADNFYYADLLDRSYGPALPFTIEGFFLQSSIDVKIKSVPIFLFVLQRKDLRESYISCFYADNYPKLLNEFIESDERSEEYAFRFNWFDHECIVPEHPWSLDEISQTFYYNEGKFLDYRVFDATREMEAKKDRSAAHLHFGSRVYSGGRYIRKNRFYKRKFNWFLKYA